MKNNKRVFIITEIVLAVLVVLVVIAMLREKNGEEKGKVSVVVQYSEDSQWAAFKYGLRMAAQDYKIEMSVVSTDGPLSADEEKKAIEGEIKNGADAVIVQPVPGADPAEILKKIEKKIPVVLVEDSLPGIPSVTPDNYAIGRRLAEELLEDYNGKMNGRTLGIVCENEDSGIAGSRREGFLSAVEGRGASVAWSVSTPAREDGQEEDALEIQEKVDFVIALDDNSLILAGKTAAANDLHGALVYGIGNSTEAVYYLDTGVARCLIVPDDFSMGYQGLKAAAKSFCNLFWKPQDQTVSFTVLRRDNLFTKENQEILFTMSQ